MANKIKKLTNDDKNNLLSKTFYVLPDNPSNKNFSPSQIKRKGYEGYVVLFDFINSLIDAVNDNFDINDTAFNEHVSWISETIQGILVRINELGTSNIENGSGTNAVQMKQDGTSGTFDFTGKNPHATEIDETLTGQITYGATGDFATSVGGKSSAQGKRSMSQGTTTIAKGKYSHSEGDNTVAYGNDSHAEGYATLSEGVASHAEGNNTIAKGEISHAEGFSTEASGQGAHAEGAHTIARGDYSHASGLNTEAGYNGQTVVGHCNDNKETTVFEVGCGWTDENGNVVQRTNAFEVYLDGHAEVKTFGTTPNSVVRRTELVEGLTDIHEKLEGKKSTYILNCGWDLEYLRTWISRGLKVENASGEDISGAISSGTFQAPIINGSFNSNSNMINPAGHLIVLKPTKENASIDNPSAETFILGTASEIFEQGDVILITQPNVPDRWYAGTWLGFYPLETRKIVKSLSLNALDTAVFGATYSLSNYTSDSVTYTDLDLFYDTYNELKGLYANQKIVTDPFTGATLGFHQGEYIFKKVGCEIRVDTDGNSYISHITYQTELCEYSEKHITLALRLTKSGGNIFLEPKYYVSPVKDSIVNVADDQTITGAKTFTQNIRLGSGSTAVRIINSNGNFKILDYSGNGQTFISPGLPIISTYNPVDGNDTYNLSNFATTTYVDSKLGIWVPATAPVSTTITSATGKSWKCEYQSFVNTLTQKTKVEYTLYSLTEETATAELISFNLLATVTIGATYKTDTIGYANLPKPISGDTYWTFDGFTFDEASDIGNQCTPLPFRGSGGFETRILVIDDTPPEQITFKKVIANVSLYQK